MKFLGSNRVHVVLLAGVLAVAAFLRFQGLGEPSYWLDEILHQTLTTDAASQPLWRWVTGFSPEHGPLYYATQLAARAFGTSEAAGRLPAALLGLATIPLVWLAARSRDAVAAPATAILLALSPLHVYYSREARAYALTMFLTAALILVLLRARSIAAATVVLLALLYASAIAGPVVAAGLLVSCAATILAPTREIRRWYASVAALSFVVLILFRVIYASKPAGNPGWPPFPVMDASFFATLTRTLSVTALNAHRAGRAAVATLLLALTGCVAVVKRDRIEGTILAGMAFIPLVIVLGTLWHLNHFYAIRYVTPALVGYVLLAGAGIAAVARLAKRATVPVAIGIAIALVTQSWAAARREPFQKLNWRGIATKIWQTAHPGDVVIATEAWSEVPLRYYIGRLPRRVTVEAVPYPQVAESLIGLRPAAWLVSAGDPSSEIRGWLCRYPLVLASPLENFRLHYASGTNDFLRERGGPAERRALAAALGSRVTLEMSAADNFFMDSGWADPEGMPHVNDFRWALGRRASITLPLRSSRDRVIRMRVLPMDHPSLPAQTLRVSVNGTSAGELTLAPGWSDHAFPARAALWVDGMNTITLDFGRAAAPATLDRTARDARPLAVAFDRISIDDADGSGRRSDLRAYTPRIASGPFIDENSTWRRTRTSFPADRLRQDRVEMLLGRLGIDPQTTWPRLQRGELHLDDLVESLAYGSECEDNHAFVQRVFAVLLDRSPAPNEERVLLPLASASRVSVTAAMMKSGEFRALVLNAPPAEAAGHTRATSTPSFSQRSAIVSSSRRRDGSAVGSAHM